MPHDCLLADVYIPFFTTIERESNHTVVLRFRDYANKERTVDVNGCKIVHLY
jgi:hypothetical protein